MDKIVAAFARRYPLIYDLFTIRLRWSLIGLALLFVATAYIQYADSIITADDLFTKYGPMVGGDFMVFKAAADSIGSPDLSSIYVMDNLSALLKETYSDRNAFLVSWQYPPTMFLFVAPMHKLPFLGGFAFWSLSLLALFSAALYSLWRDRTAIFFALASPGVFIAIITGQTGLMTASLIALAAGFADRRPLIAGIAAGLLTVKPQLGLLIPLAFAAAGCWRAFAAAALTALALAGASVAAFGVEPWFAFIEAVTTHGSRMGLETFPFYKLVTPFGAMNLIGLPPSAAGAAQAAASLALAVYVFMVWRRSAKWEIRLIALSTSVLLTTPYGFFYEFAVLVPAGVMIGKLALESGWLKGERVTLVALWIAPLFAPGHDVSVGFPISFAVAFAVFAAGARRTLPAAGFRFASAAAPLQAGS